MRAVYFIIWLILTALVCYWLYELKESSTIANPALINSSSSQQIEVIDEVSGSTYSDIGNENALSEEDNSSADIIETTSDETTSKQLTEAGKIQNEATDLDKGTEQTKTSSSDAEGSVEPIDYVERAYIEFNQNSITLPAGGKFGSYLDSVANVIKTGDFKILLEGHTDNSQSSSQNNYAVGLKRAEFIKKLLLKRDVPNERIEVISKGDTEPRNDGDTSEARELNRRVELFIKQKN